ncbi:MAG: hypothetical protein LBB49_06715 [Gracilibacteraceae bacterium]|jgi:hypothetical protein|nr:hypothetical protein [Gracilibacteraceae bacterium]
MLTQTATPEMLAEWKTTWMEYKDKLHPNRKTGAELTEYVTGKYPLKVWHDQRFTQAVIFNILQNEPIAALKRFGLIDSQETRQETSFP